MELNSLEICIDEDAEKIESTGVVEHVLRGEARRV